MTLVREMTPDDLEDWIDMRTALWPEGDHRSELQAYFDGLLDEPELAFLAIENGVPQGFIELSARADQQGGVHGFVEGLYVRKIFRGGPVARMLIEKAIEWSVESGFLSLLADRGPRLYEIQHSGRPKLIARGISEDWLNKAYPLRTCK